MQLNKKLLMLSAVSVLILMGTDDCEGEARAPGENGVEYYITPPGKFKNLIYVGEKKVCAIRDNSNIPKKLDDDDDDDDDSDVIQIKPYDPKEGEVICWYLNTKKEKPSNKDGGTKTLDESE